MPNVTDHITAARTALYPRDGQGGRTTPEQATVAIAHAEIAKAQAFDRIATALEALAAHEITPGFTLQAAIGHSH